MSIKYENELLFLVLCIAYAFLSYLANTYIINEEVIIRSYSENMPLTSIENYLELREEFSWVAYALVPIVVILKVGFVTICLSIGFILIEEIGFSLKKMFKVSLIAESIFVIYQSLYQVNMYLNIEEVTVENSQIYYPLSLLNLFEFEGLDAWLVYVLRTANLFEVIFVIVLAILVSNKFKLDFVESLNITIPSYGIGLLCWVVFVTFISLQIS